MGAQITLKLRRVKEKDARNNIFTVSGRPVYFLFAIDIVLFLQMTDFYWLLLKNSGKIACLISFVYLPLFAPGKLALQLKGLCHGSPVHFV